METQRSSTDTHFLSDNEKDELALLDAVVADYENSKGRRKSKSWIRRHWKAVGWHLLFNLFTLVLLVFGLGDLWSATGLCKSPVYGQSHTHLSIVIILTRNKTLADRTSHTRFANWSLQMKIQTNSSPIQMRPIRPGMILWIVCDRSRHRSS